MIPMTGAQIVADCVLDFSGYTYKEGRLVLCEPPFIRSALFHSIIKTQYRYNALFSCVCALWRKRIISYAAHYSRRLYLSNLLNRPC